MKDKPRIELLAPAGNREKLETAIHYGADAVYLAGKNFSLRSYSGNFDADALADAVALAHAHGVRAYVACNIYPRNDEEDAIRQYLCRIGEMRADAVIIADPGILMLARRVIGHVPIHLSTQANTTSRHTALFWQSQGVRRINAARELTLTEIRELTDAVSIEVEAFAHGAMCVAYSGRCLLSSAMTGRDANRGLCAQPCRWKYFLMEETRPGRYMPVAEDDRGTYVFNAKDLCMIDFIPDMINAGITSLKIEGRLKGMIYLAAAVKIYREAIDAWLANPERYNIPDYWRTELAAINVRGYGTGFYFKDRFPAETNLDNQPPRTPPRFIGTIREGIDADRIRIHIRNRLAAGDMVEILPKTGPAIDAVVESITSSDGVSNAVVSAGENMIIKLNRSGAYQTGDIVRTPACEDQGASRDQVSSGPSCPPSREDGQP
jgi:putative protease